MKNANITYIPGTDIPVWGHVYEYTETGKRIEVPSKWKTPADLESCNLKYIYTAYATPEIAKKYIECIA